MKKKKYEVVLIGDGTFFDWYIQNPEGRTLSLKYPSKKAAMKAVKTYETSTR
jgi:hypothetical protein